MLKIWWREIGKLRTESAPSSIGRAEAWLWCPLAHKTYNTCTTSIDKVFSIGLTAWSPTCAVSVGYWDCFLIRLAFIHVIFGYSLHHLNYGYETLSVQLLPSDSYRHAWVSGQRFLGVTDCYAYRDQPFQLCQSLLRINKSSEVSHRSSLGQIDAQYRTIGSELEAVTGPRNSLPELACHRDVYFNWANNAWVVDIASHLSSSPPCH